MGSPISSFGSKSLCAFAIFATGLVATPAFAEEEADAPASPHCTRVLGSLTVADGARTGWDDLDLPAPRPLIRAIVERSRCFRIVESGGDYVLVSELVGQAEPAQQNPAQFVGAVVESRWAGLARDASTERQGPRALLTLTRVSDAARVAEIQTRAYSQNPNWRQGATLGLGAVGRDWEDNEIGRAMASAYVDAYAQLVTQMGGLDRSAGAVSAGAVFRPLQDTNLRQGPGTNTPVLKRVPTGTPLRATGTTQEDWIQITDESGLVAWVRMDLIAPVL